MSVSVPALLHEALQYKSLLRVSLSECSSALIHIFFSVHAYKHRYLSFCVCGCVCAKFKCVRGFSRKHTKHCRVTKPGSQTHPYYDNFQENTERERERERERESMHMCLCTCMYMCERPCLCAHLCEWMREREREREREKHMQPHTTTNTLTNTHSSKYTH